VPPSFATPLPPSLQSPGLQLDTWKPVAGGGDGGQGPPRAGCRSPTWKWPWPRGRAPHRFGTGSARALRNRPASRCPGSGTGAGEPQKLHSQGNPKSLGLGTPGDRAGGGPWTGRKGLGAKVCRAMERAR
jgi:hypothetical protein